MEKRIHPLTLPASCLICFSYGDLGSPQLLNEPPPTSVTGVIDEITLSIENNPFSSVFVSYTVFSVRDFWKTAWAFMIPSVVKLEWHHAFLYQCVMWICEKCKYHLWFLWNSFDSSVYFSHWHCFCDALCYEHLQSYFFCPCCSVLVLRKNGIVQGSACESYSWWHKNPKVAQLINGIYIWCTLKMPFLCPQLNIVSRYIYYSF